jgi:phenylalanyl-tRNA synthetase alpha chain
MTLPEHLHALKAQALTDIAAAKTPADIEALEIRYVGRKGELTAALKGLADLQGDERREAGMLANEIKQELEKKLAQAREQLEQADLASKLKAEQIDVTEPGTCPPSGHLHLVTQAIQEITDIFARAGFERTRYPEVEWDWYAFEALNMQKDHPARDEWETFFMDAPASERWGKMILTPQQKSTITLRQAKERSRKEHYQIQPRRDSCHKHKQHCLGRTRQTQSTHRTWSW